MNPPEPFGVITISGSLGSEDGSLLAPLTWKEPGASPDNASIAVIVATCTSLWFGGQREHSEAGIPEITGAVLSSLMVIGTEVDRPTALLAEQVRVTPAVSAGRLVGAHPVEDVIPDSGSDTLQFTVTALRYQPLLPNVPVICGVITGGVTSTIVTTKSALVFIGSLFPAASVAMLKKP